MLDDREKLAELEMLVEDTLTLVKAALPNITPSDPHALSLAIEVLENPNDFRKIIFAATCIAADFKGYPAEAKLYELINAFLNEMGEDARSVYTNCIQTMNYQFRTGINDNDLLNDTQLYLETRLDIDRPKDWKFLSPKMNFPYSKESQEWFMESRKKEGVELRISEYAFLRGSIDSESDRFKDPGLTRKDFMGYESNFDEYCVMCASKLCEISNFEPKGNIHEDFHLMALMICDLSELLRLLKINCKLHSRANFVGGITQKPHQKIVEASQSLGKEANFVISDRLYLYHLFQGLNRIVGHTERSPFNSDDINATMDDILVGLEKNNPTFEMLEKFLSKIKYSYEEFLVNSVVDLDKDKKAISFGVNTVESTLNLKNSNPYICDETFKLALEAYLKEAKSYLEDLSTYDKTKAFKDHTFGFDYTYRLGTNEARADMDSGFYSLNTVLLFGKQKGGNVVNNANYKLLEEFFLAMQDMAKSIRGQDFMGHFSSLFCVLKHFQDMNALKGIDYKFLDTYTVDVNDEPFSDELKSLLKDSASEFYLNSPLLFSRLLALITDVLINEKMLPDDAKNWDFAVENNRLNIINTFRAGIPNWIDKDGYKEMLPFLKAFFLKANQVLRDATPKAAPAPAPAPVPPSPAPAPAPAPQGPNTLQMSASDFHRLTQFAGVYFTPKSGRLEKVHQAKISKEIDEAKSACNNQASTLPEPMSADVNLDSKDYCKAIKLVHIERKAGEAGAKLSNLICSGSIGILQGKNIMCFDFRMDEHGELVVILGGKEIQKSQFSSPAMKNFYSEMQRIILTGLKDRLVRVSTGNEQIRFAAVGSSPGPRGIPVFSPDVEEINPRNMDDMFVVENGNNNAPVPIGPLIPNETPEIAKLLAGGTQILPEDMKDMKIYQEEIRTVDNKDLKIYVPVHEDDKATVLESIRTGALSSANIFLMKQKGVVKRHGYQPWIKSKPDPRDAAYEAETLNITQRVGSDARESALRNHLLTRRVGRILDTEASLQMYLSDTPADIKRVRIRIRNAAGTYDSTMFVTDDVHHMNQGLTFANGLSDGAAFINSARGLHAQPVQTASGEVGYRVAVTLNIPQQIHYAQGSYVSIADAVASLPKAPVSNPATN